MTATDGDTCALCAAPDGPDLRTLRIGCLYDLSEVSDLFQPVLAQIDRVEKQQTLWTMKICKDCRGDFMGVLRQFIDTQMATMVDRACEELNPERNIPVRVDGRTMMMTEPEWRHFRATGKPPVQ